MRHNLRWAYPIPPVYPWMDALAAHTAIFDIAVLNDEDDGTGPSYLWSSPHFDDLPASQDLADRAYALKLIFDGALFLKMGLSYHPFELGTPIALRDGEPSRKAGFVPRMNASPFSAVTLRRRYSGEKGFHPINRQVTRHIALCRKDELAGQLLTMLGLRGIDWVSLYALKDYLTEAGWSDDEIVNGDPDKAGQVKRFTATANNTRLSGPTSRHGGMGGPKPIKTVPLALDEAAALILPATARYLDGRVATLGLDRSL